MFSWKVLLMAMTVGVVGLGIMGGAIARNLVDDGFAVLGFDIDTARRDRSAVDGIRAVGSAAAVACSADVIVLSLPGNDALATVTEAIAGADAGPSMVLECSTLGLDAKERSRALLAPTGVTLLDCPISGTGAQAVSRELVVLASGELAAFERARPVMQAFAARVTHVGPFGNGTKLKLVANLLIAVHITAAAEALALAEKLGLEVGDAHATLEGGPASSGMFDLRGRLMADGAFEPAQMRLALWQKDLDLIAALAENANAGTPLFDASVPLFERAIAARPEADTAAVFEVLRALGR